MKLEVKKYSYETANKKWIDINFENGDLTLTSWDPDNDEFYIYFDSREPRQDGDPVFHLKINKNELRSLLAGAFGRLLSSELD